MSIPDSPLRAIVNEYLSKLKYENDDEMAPRVFIATITALLCPILDEPVWIYIIAPAGSGKTLTVETVAECEKFCLLLTTPTENAFMSGFEDDDGTDPSLIKMLNGKVLIWKDFTALINGPQKIVAKVYGELRDAFDQHCSKASGKSGLKKYRSRFGMIACVTNKIDGYADEHQQLGERFLSFRMNRIRRSHHQRVQNLGPIVESMKSKKVWKYQLQKVVEGELEKINDYAKKLTEIPVLPAGAQRKVVLMADVLALARTVPDDTTAVDAELATRLVQQLLNLGYGHCIADQRKTWDDSDTELVKRVFVDSLSAVRARLLRWMFRQGKHLPTQTLEAMAGVCMTGKREMFRIANQYVYSGIFQIESVHQSEDNWYRLAPDIYSSLSEIGVFDK